MSITNEASPTDAGRPSKNLKKNYANSQLQRSHVEATRPQRGTALGLKLPSISGSSSNER